MTLKRLFGASAVAASLGLIAALGIANYVPPVHAIHAVGAQSVGASVGGSLLPYRGRVPAATMSLETLRRALWTELRRQNCDAVSVLTQRFWPALAQMPATLYLPLATAGGASILSGPSGYNVEYLAVPRRLVVHEYVSQPLVVWHHVDSSVGAGLAPGLVVLVISTRGMSSGVVNIREDFWIERVNGDEAIADQALGMVELPA